MSNVSLILLLMLWFPTSASLAMGHQVGRASDGTVNNARQAGTQTGYHGPAALGPLSIDNKVGGIEFHKFLSIMGGPAAPKGMYVCYYDKRENIFLVVERGADDRSLVRGLTLSRIEVCPEGKISDASGFSTWATEKGIRLGSTAKDVLSKYGEPSSVWDLHTDQRFSPYPKEGDRARMKNRERILVYLPAEDAPDTSHAFFGIRNGVVVWMTLSDNE